MASSGNWMQGAVKNPGGLHRALGVPQGKKIPAAKLAAARNSSDAKTRKMANLATTFKKIGAQKSKAGSNSGGY